MPDEESLFADALALPPGEPRRAFLDAACDGDPALRARLGRLVDADERGSGILDLPAAGPPGLAGTVVAGRYRLVEPIGEGGMGSVWLADQTEPVRRRVALKLIRPGMDSRPLLARFEAERQALALMDHPNIARVLDGGTAPDGRPFFAMEYVQGTPITDFCDAQRLGVADRLALFLTVCRAVQHAHTKGIIHRDLKPGNILVSLRDGRPEPTVIDFGLAKATGPPLAESTLHTSPGAALGTPLYMSPEQAHAGNLDIDARADVYALGVILYELLTGTPPLERQRFRDAAWDEILRLIREEEPPRPSARLSGSDSLPSLAALRHTEPVRLARLLRGDLDWIVMKCLEKDRERRYETPSGLARDISRFLADESVEARPPSAGYRLRKFLRRNRGPVAALAAVLLLLVGGIVGTTWGLLRAERARQAEAARLEQVRQANELLASVFDDLDPQEEAADGKPLRVILADRLARAADRLDGEQMGDRLAVASLQNRLGRSLYRLGEPAAAIDVLEKAVATRSELLGPGHVETLESATYLAEAQGAAGRSDLAIPLLERTLATGRSALGPDHPQTLLVLNSLASTHAESGRPDLARPLHEEGLRLTRELMGPGHPSTLVALNNLAVVYQATDQPGRAVPLLQEAFDRMKAELGPDHPDTLAALNNLAGSHRAAGDRDRALAIYRAAGEALEHRRFQSLHTRPILHNLIGSLEERGLLEEAEAWRRKGLPVVGSTAGIDSIPYADALKGLGVNLIRQEKWQAAEAPLRESLDLRLATDPTSIDVPDTRMLLGRTLAGLGKFEEAEPLILGGFEAVAKAAEEGTLPDATLLPAARQRVLRLYELWDRPEKVQQWQARFAE